MKKSLWSKLLSIWLILSMILTMLPVTSLSAATEMIEEEEPISAIPDLDEVIMEDSSELAGVIAFAQGEIPGYGSSGKFLAPIGAPAVNATPIYTAQDLDNVRNNLTGSFKLMNDIDLSGYNGGQWVPIGYSHNSKEGATISLFAGTFDGQGYVIKNLRITDSTYQYNGLFGYVTGWIKNVGLEATQISISVPSASSSFLLIGTVCGCADRGAISNCYNTGDILSSATSSSDYSATSYAGGICGHDGSISNCYNTGGISSSVSGNSTKTASSDVGGICGNSGTTLNCFNTGNISSSCPNYSRAHVGGVCGNNGSGSNCYNTGNISSNTYSVTYAGGIMGYGSCSNSYNAGLVAASCYSSSAAYAGGICGYGTQSIANCYNMKNVNSYSVFSAIAGGICGYSSYPISNSYNTGNVASFYASSSNYAGGICGRNSDSISDCVVLSDRIYADDSRNADVYNYLIGYGGLKIGNKALSGISGNAVDDSHERISLDQAKSQATYEALGWDFSSIWTMAPGYEYPQLSWALVYDANLAGLDVSAGIVWPDFNSITTDYIVWAPYTASSIIISAPTNNPGATTKQGGVVYSSEFVQPLEVGSNTVIIEVAPEIGTNEKTYTVTVNRAMPSSDAKLKNLSVGTDDHIAQLDPFFDPDETSYTVSVPYEISNIAILAETDDQNATIEGIGEKHLEEGGNSFGVDVTAEDGMTKETYTIVVTRDLKPSSPAIIDIIPSRGELTPSFDMNETNYTVSVAGDVSSISITVLTGEEDISIYFSQGSSYQAGKQWISDPLNLNLPEKIITVYVYKDGLPQASYNITVMRDPQPTPIYKWEATGNIGTIGRVLFDVPNDPNFLDKYALVCDEDINSEIYLSPKRTENAIAADQNTYVFAVRLPNGETKKDISFSFKPIGGAIEKNKTIIYGDVNEDGDVSTTDATLVTRWAGGNVTTVLKNILAADINGDGSITTTDATLITRRAGGNTSTVFTIEAKF